MTLQQVECNLIAMIINKNHTALAYADSTVTLCQSKAHLEKTFNKTGNEQKKIGLTANYEKTKIMKLLTQNLTLKINNHMFAIVDEFKYLGSTVNIINNIRNRI